MLGVVASKKCAAAGSEAGVADLRKTGRLTAILISINTYDVVKNDYIYGPYTYKYKYIYIYIYVYIYIKNWTSDFQAGQTKTAIAARQQAMR